MEAKADAELIDDGTKQDRLGRRKVPRARAEALLTEYEASGLTQAQFARRAGVNYQTFASWVQRRRQGAALPPGKPAVRFAEVSLPTTRAVARELSVTFADGLIVRGHEVESLAALVRALRSSC